MINETKLTNIVAKQFGTTANVIRGDSHSSGILCQRCTVVCNAPARVHTRRDLTPRQQAPH